MSEELNRSQISTLLYFETCCVDRCGKVDSRRINSEDIKNAEEMEKMGLLHFGRIRIRDWGVEVLKSGAHWVDLTDKGWEEAHKQRKARALRMKINWNLEQ